MKFRPLSLAFASIVGLVACTPLRTQESRLPTVLAQMDTASKNFKSAQADFVWDYYQAVVKDTSTQTGRIYFRHQGGGSEMGALVEMPKKLILQYKDGTLRYNDVSNNQVRDLKAGANQAQYESFLTLGFGGSGRELAQAWTITDQGSESMSDGGQAVKTEKLDLVSKDPNVRNMFTHVTIWVDPVRGVSLKQIFETPSHDRRTAIYSHIKLNGSVDVKPFTISSKAVKVN